MWGGFQDQCFAFQGWKYTNKDTNGRESWKECWDSFLWTRERFSLRNSPSRNSALFSSRRSAWPVFNQSRQRSFLKKFQVHNVLYGRGKHVLKREFLFLWRFHRRFEHFDIGVKVKCCCLYCSIVIHFLIHHLPFKNFAECYFFPITQSLNTAWMKFDAFVYTFYPRWKMYLKYEKVLLSFIDKLVDFWSPNLAFWKKF